MDFPQMLYNVMDFIYQTLFMPVFDFVESYFDELSLKSSFDLSGLFGINTFPSFNISDLVLFIIAFAVSITALILFIKFMKWLTGFIRSLFSGVKK